MCIQNDAELRFINNSSSGDEEKRKLLGSNILMIGGGNTFDLLNRLKKSGLIETIKQFCNKENYIAAGFSAGALVLSPNIQVCNYHTLDENLCSLSELDSIGAVDFELFVHFHDDLQTKLETYRAITGNDVRSISDNDFIVVDK